MDNRNGNGGEWERLIVRNLETSIQDVEMEDVERKHEPSSCESNYVNEIVNSRYSQELGEKIQRKQDEIKQKISDALKSCANKSFEETLIECIKEFRQYLNSIGINQDKKGELVYQLEKSLSLMKRPKKNKSKNSPQLECHKVVSDLDSIPTSQISKADKTCLHNFDIHPLMKSTEQSKTAAAEVTKSQCKETNLDKTIETSERIQLRLNGLDSLVEKYYEQMRKEVIQKNYMATNDSYDKIHEEITKTIKNQEDFPIILDCQDLKELFDTAIAFAKLRLRFEVKEIRKDRKNKLTSVLSKWEDYILNNFDELIKSSSEYFDVEKYLHNLLGNAVKNEIPYNYNQSYFQPLLLEHAMTTEKFKIWVEEIKKFKTCFTSYQDQINKKLEMFRRLEEDKFEEFHQQFLDQIQETKLQSEDKTHEKVIDLMGKTFNKVKKQYKEINREIIDSITVRNVFLKEDQQILAPLNNSCDFKKGQIIQNNAQLFGEGSGTTSDKEYEKANNTMLELLKTKTKGLVARQRKLYNDKMNQFLPSRGPSKNDLELEKKHKEFLAEVTKLLKMEISYLKVDIDGSHYVSSLQDNVEKDWSEIQKLNAKLRAKEFQDKKRLKEEEEEMRKAETEKEENKRQTKQELLAEEKKVKQKKIKKK